MRQRDKRGDERQDMTDKRCRGETMTEKQQTLSQKVYMCLRQWELFHVFPEIDLRKRRLVFEHYCGYPCHLPVTIEV